MADCAAVMAQCGNLSRNELTRNLLGNTWPQLSQFTEPLWTDPGLRGGISVQEPISASKKKKAQAGYGQTFSQNPWKQEKSHHH